MRTPSGCGGAPAQGRTLFHAQGLALPNTTRRPSPLYCDKPQAQPCLQAKCPRPFLFTGEVGSPSFFLIQITAVFSSSSSAFLILSSKKSVLKTLLQAFNATDRVQV